MPEDTKLHKCIVKRCHDDLWVTAHLSSWTETQECWVAASLASAHFLAKDFILGYGTPLATATKKGYRFPSRFGYFLEKFHAKYVYGSLSCQQLQVQVENAHGLLIERLRKWMIGHDEEWDTIYHPPCLH